MAKKRAARELERSRINPLHSLQSSSDVQETITAIVQYLKQEKGLTLQQLLQAYQETIPEQLIPIQIFSFSLSPAESLTKYLKENRGLRLRDIGKLLHRDERTAWINYRGAQRKHSTPFSLDQSPLLIPISVLADRSLSILEHVVFYLHSTFSLSTKDIANILHKHPAVIHTCLSRAKTKRGKPTT